MAAGYAPPFVPGRATFYCLREYMLTRCKNLEWMVERHLVPIESGVWVDAYNKIISRGFSGTITVQMNPSNQRFVTELYVVGSNKNKE